MELSSQEFNTAIWFIISGLLAGEAQRSFYHLDLQISSISELDKFIGWSAHSLMMARRVLLIWIAFQIGLLFAAALFVASFLIGLVSAILVPLITLGERPIVWKLSGYAMWPAFIISFYYTI